MKFINRKRKGTFIEMSPVSAGEATKLIEEGKVSCLKPDKKLIGSLKENIEAGWIARNSENHNDMWFINLDYAMENYSGNENLSFGEALEYIKDGYLVQRSGWNGKGMFVFLVNGSRFEVNRPPLNNIYEEGTVIEYSPHIDMKTADGSIVPWLASQTDVLAEDWEVIKKV